MSLLEVMTSRSRAPERSLAGYLLVQAAPGCAERIALAMRTLDLIDEATLVAGPYDVIARVGSAPDAASWSRLVSEAWDIPGVLRAVPCLPSE